MTQKCLDQFALECTSGPCDKLYIIQVQEVSTASTTSGTNRTYQVVCYYGRRGSTLKRICKSENVTSRGARDTAIGLATEKERKGYTHMILNVGDKIPGMPVDAPGYGVVVVTSGATAHSRSAAPTVHEPLPMLPAPLEAFSGATDFARKLTETGVPSDFLADHRILGFVDAENWAFQRKYDGERIIIRISENELQATNRRGHLRPLTQAVADRLSLLQLR